MLVFFTNLTCRILSQELDLILSFLKHRWLHVVLQGKSYYAVDACVLLGSIFVLTLSLLCNDLPDDICNIAIYADDTILYSNCDQASDFWHQLELASKLKSVSSDTGIRQEVAC